LRLRHVALGLSSDTPLTQRGPPPDNAGGMLPVSLENMRASNWIRSPRGLLALCLGTGALLVCSLLWLGWQLVCAEREVAAQHALERRENAAELAALLLGRPILEAAAQLDALIAAPPGAALEQAARLGDALPADSVLLVGEARHAEPYPAARLPYRPLPDFFWPPSNPVLVKAEQDEARGRGDEAARALVAEMRASADPWVRATALARLARIENKRSAGHDDRLRHTPVFLPPSLS